MSPEQADDFISEHGTGVSPMDVFNRERDAADDASRAVSAQVLADLSRDAWKVAIDHAVRAQEMDLFTDSWECANPDAERREKLATRRAQAEAEREEAAIMRRRAQALEDGAVALGWKGPDDGR